MAKWLDRFMGSMNLVDDMDDEDMEDYADDTDAEVSVEEEDVIPERNSKAYKRMMNTQKYDYSEDEAEEEEEEESSQKGIFGFGKTSARSSQSQSARSTRSARPKAAMEVSMIRPTTMDDARDICDMLISGRAVVINMEGVQVDLAQRIIDFSSGACYSIEGNLQKISNYIFIITPNNIELSGDFTSAVGSLS